MALRKLADRGRPGPLKIINSKPRLPEYLEFYWTAFQRLSSCRHYGPTSVSMIPWTAMDRYAEKFFIGPEEYDDFLTLMEGLDRAFLANQPKPDKTGKNKNKD